MKKTTHFFLLQAYGDNLVTLSILNQLSDSPPLIVHGTKLTQIIAKILNVSIEFHMVFDSIPSFYHIRQDGGLNAFISFFKLIHYINNTIPKGSQIVFEKSDFRLYLLKQLCPGYYFRAPFSKHNFYIDKATCFSNLLKTPMLKFTQPLRPNNPKRILINPTGSRSIKNLSFSILNNIIEIITELNIEIDFIDYQNIYTLFEHKVSNYYTNTTLEEAVLLLRNVDAYCGPDSLFIHLAYNYEKPFFCFMNYESSYYLPPNSIDNYNITNELDHKVSLLSFKKWIETTC